MKNKKSRSNVATKEIKDKGVEFIVDPLKT